MKLPWSPLAALAAAARASAAASRAPLLFAPSASHHGGGGARGETSQPGQSARRRSGVGSHSVSNGTAAAWPTAGSAITPSEATSNGAPPHRIGQRWSSAPISAASRGNPE